MYQSAYKEMYTNSIHMMLKNVYLLKMTHILTAYYVTYVEALLHVYIQHFKADCLKLTSSVIFKHLSKQLHF